MITAGALKGLEFYKANRMRGDYWATELVDHYLDQRRKILLYRGPSEVDRASFYRFEKVLISPEYKFWWYYADKSWINKILWLLRRFKVGLGRETKRNLLGNWVLDIPYHRGFSIRCSKEFAEACKVELGES